MPHFRYGYVVRYEDTKGVKHSEKPTYKAMEALETARSLVEMGKRNVTIHVNKAGNMVMTQEKY